MSQFSRRRFFFQCNCSGDGLCEQTKSQMKTCAEEVEMATQENAIVSCETAQWICSADAMCSTALDYYNRFCQAMFKGKKCTDRCLNSINILQRQKAARKLQTCFCTGDEDFDCRAIKTNMEQLCFTDSNTIDDSKEVLIKISSSVLKPEYSKFLILSLVFAVFYVKRDN